MSTEKPFRVLSIDGGGMRGLYTATYLETLCRRFNNGKILDIGASFDLIVGTSTGGILACGIAAAVPVDHISLLYQEHGEAIFPSPTPDLDGRGKLSVLQKMFNWERSRSKWAPAGQTALRDALEEVLGQVTIEDIWALREIALCVPTVNMSNHKPWVFKTPHLPGKDRDNKYSLVNVCLATAAAPILFPLAVTDVPESNQYNVFADGGLWANNPVMVGMTEALQLAQDDQPIEIVSIGTCEPPSGRVVPRDGGNWGLGQWRGGMEILTTSLDAQSAGSDFIASQIAPHLNRPCKLIRLPSQAPSGDQTAYVGMDKSGEMPCKVLSDLGRNDAESTHGRITRGAEELQIVGDIFKTLGEFK